MAMKTRQHTQGFTLIELMITITLIGIMATLAMPSMRDFLVRQRLASDVNRVTTLFNFARSEAVRRNQPVLICGGITIKSDSKPNNGCGNIQGSNTAFLAFVDKDNNNNYNNNNDEALRSALLSRDGDIRIITLGLGLTPKNGNQKAARFSFLPNGTFAVGLMQTGNPTPTYDYSAHYARITASNGNHVYMSLVAPSGRVISCGSLTKAQFDSLWGDDYKTYCAFN